MFDMLAVIATGGKQYKVSENQIISIEKLPQEAGKEVEFNEVLLISDAEGNDVKIGTPFVKNAKVTAKVVEQFRTPKVVGIKFHSKTRHKRKYTHRQEMTKVQIIKIAA